MTLEKVLKEVKSWIIMLGVSICLFFLCYTNVFATAQVKQSSMESTLLPEQRLFVDKVSYNFSKPERGDIIIFLAYEEVGNFFDRIERLYDEIKLSYSKDFAYMNENKRLVKRVIGVEGDIIEIKDGCVYVNDIKLEEPYTKGVTIPDVLEFPITVEEHKLFVLGDNRETSIDSREFGLIDVNQVEGKAVFRIYPLNKIGVLN